MIVPETTYLQFSGLLNQKMTSHQQRAQLIMGITNAIMLILMLVFMFSMPSAWYGPFLGVLLVVLIIDLIALGVNRSGARREVQEAITTANQQAQQAGVAWSHEEGPSECCGGNYFLTRVTWLVVTFNGPGGVHTLTQETLGGAAAQVPVAQPMVQPVAPTSASSYAPAPVSDYPPASDYPPVEEYKYEEPPPAYM